MRSANLHFSYLLKDGGVLELKSVNTLLTPPQSHKRGYRLTLRQYGVCNCRSYVLS